MVDRNQPMLWVPWMVLVLCACEDTDATSGTSTQGSGGSGGTRATTGSSSGGGGEGAGGDGAGGNGGDVCGDEGAWTCVDVEPTGAYGTRTFSVPAAQNWVQTGLYLHAGEQATISESGEWFVNDDAGAPIDHGPCLKGDFVARIGLHYKDPQLFCVQGSMTITADKDGVLFVGALPSNDLGESYETRRNATGAKTVTISSDGMTVPTVESEHAAEYGYGEVGSGWVEVRGDHTILTLPLATVQSDASIVRAAVERIDQFYELHAQLRGGLPQHGQRIRFFPDPNIDGIGYMLAGNPVRMDPVLVDAVYENRITRAGISGVDVWGFAHELGHDFTFVNGLWWYRENSLEAWPNVFSVHALEAQGLPLHGNLASCTADAPVPYDTWDPWAGLCFLLQFQQKYGWEFYETFFEQLNTTEHADVPSGPEAWHFVHDRFEQIAGEDVTPLFVAWGVPNPG